MCILKGKFYTRVFHYIALGVARQLVRKCQHVVGICGRTDSHNICKNGLACLLEIIYPFPLQTLTVLSALPSAFQFWVCWLSAALLVSPFGPPCICFPSDRSTARLMISQRRFSRMSIFPCRLSQTVFSMFIIINVVIVMLLSSLFRIPLCKLINQHLHELAMRFSSTKFVKGRASVCIPNYPEKNLPTIFIYK